MQSYRFKTAGQVGEWFKLGLRKASLKEEVTLELRTNEENPVEQRSWGKAFWTERCMCLYEKSHHLC